VTGIAAIEQARLDFEALVRGHQAMVFSLAWHFLHDRDAAQDVAQEVFWSLHRNMAAIQSEAHAEFWLRKVTVQRSIDEGRKRRRKPQVALASVAEPSVSGAVRDPLLEDVLRRLVATLPEAPRAVMILRYQEELDPAEIARLLEMPVPTVKSHLQRSLALLRQKLERRGIGEA
jgi:RNA polymerase sigma-70 factor, ECF subfamily